MTTHQRIDRTSSSRDAVIAAWATFATRNRDKVSAVFTADAEWLAPPDNATALAMDGTHHMIGRDRIARFITEEFPRVFVDDVDVEFRGVYADGNVVVVEERMTSTLFHGGHYANDYCFVFELEDGLISRVREYMDTQRGAQWFAEPRPRPPDAAS
jgi:hypothetical protein